MEKSRKFWKKRRFLFVFVGLAVLIILVIWADPQTIWDNILGADLKLVLMAIVMNLAATILMIVRWMVLYKTVSKSLPGIDSSKIFLIGQATNQIAPMGTGELARAYVGYRYYMIRFSKTLVPSVIERVMDISFFLILSLVCFTIFIPSGQFYFQIGIFILLLMVGFLFILRPQTLDRFVERLEVAFENRGKFLARLSSKILSSWESFKKSMYVYHKRKGTLFVTGVFTVTIWTIDAITQYMLLRAFGVYIPIYFVIGIISASFIIGALSFLPGGLGAREFAFATLVTFVAVDWSVGLSVALVYKGIVYLIIGIGALLAISTLPTASFKQEKTKS
jgi:uncharacterized protein (TIRG00374 family)